jgi:hypothetical protein
MRWVGQEARMEEVTNAYKICIEKPEGKICRFEEIGVEWRIKLNRY